MVPSASLAIDLHTWPVGQEPLPGVNPPDTLDDVWQQLFNAWGLDPIKDADNDGCSNWFESQAGTNPFVAGDCLKIGNTLITASEVLIYFDAKAGKKYSIVSDDVPNGLFATTEDLQSPESGTSFVPAADISNKFLKVAKAPGSRKFYRLKTEDVDSNGDGVSDWVARQLGMDPEALVMGDLDGNGQDDLLDMLESQLSEPDEISVIATAPFASEDGPTAGTFTISRTRSLFDARVTLNYGGTANSSTDYSRFPSAPLVEFEPGESSTEIHINPVQDDNLEGGESVTLTLSNPESDGSGTPPVLGSESATVIIGNETAPSGTGLLARYYDAGSTNYDNAAVFGSHHLYVYTRSGTDPNFTGNTLITPLRTSDIADLEVDHQVKLSFTGGNLNNATYNNQTYTVTAISANGATFTVAMPPGSSLPASSNSTGYFKILSYPHPPVIQRVDPVVDNLWLHGTPNGVVIAPRNSPDNFSSSWETYLNPTTASTSGYRFRLDADDKARVLLDLNGNGVFDSGEQIIEHGWDSPAVVGTFKTSASYNLDVPANPSQRYRMRVEQVETTGEARCWLQWSVNGGTFANIPQANQFTHTQAATYSYAAGNLVVTPTGGHSRSVVENVELSFSTGALFVPGFTSTNNGTFQIAEVNGTTTFTVPISGTSVVKSATTTNGSATVTVLSTTDLAIGMRVTGNGIPASRYIVAIPSATTFTLNSGTSVTAQNPTSLTCSRNGLQIPVSGAVVTQGSRTVLVPSVEGLVAGMLISGPGLANNSTISLVGDGKIVVSANASSNQANSTLTAVLHPTSAHTGSGFVLNTPTSGTTGVYNLVYPNTTFSGSPGRTGTSNAVTVENNGVWGTGTPDLAAISPDTFSVVWSGQVQPQFSEEYTFYAQVDDGCRLWINGEEMVMRQLASGNVGSSTYTYNSITGETIVNYNNAVIALNQFAVGDVVRVDPTAGTLTSFATTDLQVTAATSNSFTVFFPTGFGDQITGASANVDALNRIIKPWASSGNERYCRIPLIGGKRYDIRLEYYENLTSSRCLLFWNSLSQPKQIIPSNRLYPENTPMAPSEHVSDAVVTALVGGPVSIPISLTNGASVSPSGLPSWLTYSNGVLSGTPPADAEGTHQIVLTLTNANGSSQSVINLSVVNTGGEITRDLWTGVSGSSMDAFPAGAPTSSSTLTLLEAPADFGDNYATRLRGYLTAPETGNYYFWLAASNAAELYIANDAEPVNTFHRASVTPGSTTPLDWDSATKSPWMALEQGKRYYIEIRHKAGTGAGDNLALGWSKPGQPTETPSEVVPGYVLSPWSEPVAPTSGGTIYASTMRPQAGAVTNASGSSFLRLNEAETEAIISVNYTGLTSAFFGMHVHDDNIPGGGTNNIIADLEEPGDVQLLPDGTYKWVLKPTAGYTVANLVQHIKAGEVYFNVHSVMYPGGEIKGYYNRLDGSPVFVPPPAPTSWSDDSDTDLGAVRFLAQATFGANIADIQALKAITPSGGKTRYELWIEDQFTKPTTESLPEVLRTRRTDAQGGSAYSRDLVFNSWWRNSVSGEDQLRQRMAFALSQIHVVSGEGPLQNRGEALAFFYDRLADGAFGNFRDILEVTTLTPTMGRYLDMLRNDKPDLGIGRIPNENYGREIKQLFSVGLFRMWPDGSLILNSKFEPIDTYSQREIVGYAHVFTGWDYGYDGAYRTTIGAAANWMSLMREVPARHFTGHKRILNNEVLPGIEQIGSQSLDPYAAHNGMVINNPDYQALPQVELDAAHDQLFNHPNTGPFICRQLIQRLVTSHPSRGYVYRVVQAFNNNGESVRGDMKAVIKAILLDHEARSSTMIAEPAYGKQREPLLRVTAAARAFRPGTFSGTYSQSGTRTISISTAPNNHNLANGNVFLEFSGGSPDPFTGVYSATVTGNQTLTVQAYNWANGTYSIPANSTTCTVTMSNHWLQVGNQFFIDFTSGPADNTAVDGQVYTVLTNPNPSSSGNNGSNFTFTVSTTSTSTRSGNCMIPRFSPGSYTVAASGLPAPNDRRVTMRTVQDHHLSVGNQVQLNIYGGNPLPADVVATVDTIPDNRTWTFLISSSVTGYQANQGNNSVYQFPLLSQPLNRSGDINSRPSTFQMGNTDAATPATLTANLDQSPLNAETVFNYFLPDYKYPGVLAGLNLTTPEFQLTAETTTVRQANFIYNGIFNPSSTNDRSSFSTGNNALILDFSPWMVDDATNLGLGEAPSSTTLPWTHNQNIVRLIRNMSRQLTADQLSATSRNIIRDLVSLQISSITTGNPCTVNTLRPHGYKTGDTVYIKGVSGGTFSPSGIFGNNNDASTITVVDEDTFTVNSVSCTVVPTSVANAHVSQILYNQGSSTPDAAHRRDRIRSIIHLILTSPDFTIQR